MSRYDAGSQDASRWNAVVTSSDGDTISESESGDGE